MWRGRNRVLRSSCLLQAKHHVGVSAGLADKDIDIWKTLLVWMNSAQPTDPEGPALVLVTTSIAQPDTAAYALRSDVRDTSTAVIRLTDAARSSSAENTKKARERFLGEARLTCDQARRQTTSAQVRPRRDLAQVRACSRRPGRRPWNGSLRGSGAQNPQDEPGCRRGLAVTTRACLPRGRLMPGSAGAPCAGGR